MMTTTNEIPVARTQRGRGRSERGAALLEVAMTLPILLLVAVGIFEFGRAYQTWQVLTNAAREGARIAVLPGTDDASVEDRVQEYMAAGQLSAADDATVTITRDNEIAIGAGTASASRVEVAYPYTFSVLQPVANLVVAGSTAGEPITMTATATMRNEM
jgi:Flp pilus assembly protein TadG